MAVLHIWEIKILSNMNLVLFHLDTIMLNFLLAIGIYQTKDQSNHVALNIGFRQTFFSSIKR